MHVVHVVHTCILTCMKPFSIKHTGYTYMFLAIKTFKRHLSLQVKRPARPSLGYLRGVAKSGQRSEVPAGFSLPQNSPAIKIGKVKHTFIPLVLRLGVEQPLFSSAWRLHV